MLVDQRILAIQSDPQQVRSINEFTDSLARELGVVERMPGKALMRELLAGGLRRALDLGGPEPKRRFLEALSGNIHKFPLQEQRSLARVYPVEISSEYRNLASFVEDAGAPEDETPRGPDGAAGQPAPNSAAATAAAATASAPRTGGTGAESPGGAPAGGGAAPAAAAEGGGPLQELRRRLGALPQRPGTAAEELAARLSDEETARALEAADARTRTALFGDVRLSLFKFPEASQKELVERFQELRVEVARLVESMTQEISRWLDEERAAARHGGAVAPLFPKLKALFQAVLSAPFLTTFKHLGGSEKRGKETFLLKLALCLRVVAERAPKEAGGEPLLGQASQLRRQFFYVEGYGELMEDWLQNRVKQFNEEFATRASTVLASSPHPVLARLRRTFRPGQWLSLSDPQVEEDLFALFLDEAFPRHVLTNEAVARVLQKVSSYGGAACDFHVYGGIARLPPAAGSVGRAPPPQDAVEASLLQVLQRLPPFPSLRRLRPGHFMFGRQEVEFLLRDGALLARYSADGALPLEEVPAEDCFARRGPEEFPNAASLAVQAAAQSPSGAPSTTIEVASALPEQPVPGGGVMGSFMRPMLPPPPLSLPRPGHLPLPQVAGPPLLGTGPGVGPPGMGLSSLPRGPLPQAFPVPGQMPRGPPTLGSGKFGLDDDEI